MGAETPRERQIRTALESLEFFESGRKVVREMDETIAGREGRQPEERECRDCGYTFMTKMEDKGTKWTSLCTSCLHDQM